MAMPGMEPNYGSKPRSYHKELDRIKCNIEKSYSYFKQNYDRFNHFRSFVFDTSLDPDTVALLKTLKKPQIEFNILEAYISRLRGEFSKQEPNFEVMAGDEEPVDPRVIKVVEGHIKHIVREANKDGFEYQIYTDMLSGGFSVAKIWTEYAGEMSMNQVIRVGRVYDPILCGFDPMARLPHKGDGQYCFELFPKNKEEFMREYPDVNLDRLKFVKSIDGFSWTYKNNKEDIILVGEYFEKKKKKVKIVQLADNRVMTMKEYKEMVKNWDPMRMEVPPAIKGNPRETEIETICRYRIIENQVLEYKEMDYKILPLIFFDGNSILIRHEISGEVSQMTRPYVYQAKGIQLLKNFAGQTLANELENMIQHKFMISKEALPNEEDYHEAYRNVQMADVLVYNQFDPMMPDKPLTPPQVIPRVPIPPEVTNTFVSADQLTQTILGNFDMDLGKLNRQQVSGIAIQESVTQSNTAAMPFIVGFLQGWGRLGTGIIDLIPKYFVTPRTIPVIGINGEKTFVPVNQGQTGQQRQQLNPDMQGQSMGMPDQNIGGEQESQNINLNYGENALHVNVEPGINFSVQKSRALVTIIELMNASPLFAQFMNTDGLEILLDNIEIKGIDQIKASARQWMQQQKQMQQQAMNQPNPAMEKINLDKQKLQMKGQEGQNKLQLDMAKLQKDQMKIMADLKIGHDNNLVQALKAQTEKFAKTVDLQLKGHDTAHQHAKDHAEHHLKREDQAHKHHIERQKVNKPTKERK